MPKNFALHLQVSRVLLQCTADLGILHDSCHECWEAAGSILQRFYRGAEHAKTQHVILTIYVIIRGGLAHRDARELPGRPLSICGFLIFSPKPR